MGLLVGMGGNGKTTLLRTLLKTAHRALSFDPLGVMYPGILIKTRGELENWLDLCGDNSRYRLVYRPQVDPADYEAMKLEADYLCWIGRSVKNVSLFFDELDSFARTDDASPELTYLLNFGRVDEVSIYGSVRRPQVKVPRDWITEATVVYVFQTTDSLDCGFLERKTGIPAGDQALVTRKLVGSDEHWFDIHRDALQPRQLLGDVRIRSSTSASAKSVLKVALAVSSGVIRFKS